MPFILRVDYLDGLVTGSRGRREQLEYPPHPDRLFMALVATAGKTRTYDAEKDAYVQKLAHPLYRKALEWLEALDPPRIYAPHEPLDVLLLGTYVPVNYSHRATGGKLVLPPYEMGARHRVPRVRPLGIIDRPIFYAWTAAPPPEIAAALAELAKDVPYLGTTWSSVAVRVVPEIEEPFRSVSCLRPLEDAELPYVHGMELEALRVPAPGRLEVLDREYARVLEFLKITSRTPSKTREIPMKTYDGAPLIPYVWVGRRGPGDGHVLARSAVARFRLRPTLPLVWSGLLGEAVHAVLARAVDGLRRRFPNVDVEGYATGSGSYRALPHVGMVPLADVGASFSGGGIKGFAVLFPESEGITRGIVETIYEAILQKIAASEETLYLDFAQVNSEKTIWPPERHIEFQVEPLDDRPFFGRAFAEEDASFTDRLMSPSWETQKKSSPSKKSHPFMYALKWMRWKRPSKLWASVTPVILPRFPKKNLSILQIVNEQLQALGYPVAHRVTYRPLGALTGTPSVHDFRAFGTRYLENVWMHLILEFEREIVGPVVAGKGIYFGYGFFAPVMQRREEDDE